MMGESLVVACPSCKQGTIRATLQTFTTYGASGVTLSPPDGDSFISADCTAQCGEGLWTDGSDGLSRAYLVDGEGAWIDEPDTDERADRWIAAVRELLDAVRALTPQ